MSLLSFVFCFLFLHSYFIGRVHNYPSGPPSMACGDNQPQHAGLANPPSGKYQLATDATEFHAEKPINFQLRATGDSHFRGFLIDAKDSVSGLRVGSWAGLTASDVSNSTRSFCGDGLAIGHADRHKKFLISLVWTPPLLSFQNLTYLFSATVVEDFNYFEILLPLVLKQKFVPEPPVLNAPVLLDDFSFLSGNLSLSTVIFSYNAPFSGSSPLVKYSIFIDSNPTPYYTGLKTLINIPTLKPNTKYVFTVQASNSELSAQQLLTVTTPPVNAPVPDPAVLNPIKQFTSACQLSWTAGDLKGLQLIEFLIFYNVVGSKDVKSASAGLATSYLWTGLLPNTDYEFAIKTIVAGHQSSLSAKGSKTTDGCDNNCSGNGVCYAVYNTIDDANCFCAVGFGGSDCSFKFSQPPIFVSPQVSMNVYINRVNSTIGIRARFWTKGWTALLFAAHNGMIDGRGWRVNVDSRNLAVIQPIFAPELHRPHDTGVSRPKTIGFQMGEFTDLQFIRDLQPDSKDDSALAIDFSQYADTTVPVSWAYGVEHDFSFHKPGCYGANALIDMASGEILLIEKMNLTKVYLVTTVTIIATIIVLSLLIHFAVKRSVTAHRLIYSPLFAPAAPADSTAMKMFDAVTLDLRSNLSVSPFELCVMMIYAVTLLAFFSVATDPNRPLSTSFGYLLVWHLPLIFFPVTKNSIILVLFSIPSVPALKVHRILARLSLGWLLVHFFTKLNIHGNEIISSFNPTEYGKGTAWGFATLISVSGLVAFAFEPIRRRFYPLFWTVHMMGIPCVIVFACLHCKLVIWGFIVPLVIYGFDRAVRWNAGRKVLRIEEIELFEDPKRESVVTKLGIRVPAKEFLYKPGDYIYISLPEIGLESHPISVSSSPAETRETGLLTVHIKSEGRDQWSGKIAALARKVRSRNEGKSLNGSETENAAENTLLNGSALTARIHGPAARSITLEYERFATLIIAGAGIGVTPWLGLMSELLDRRRRDVLNQKVFFIWTARSVSLFRDLKPELLIELQKYPDSFTTFLYANDTTGGLADESPLPFKVHRERVFLPGIFFDVEKLVNPPVAVLSCGPDRFIRQTEELAREDHRKWNYHQESFKL